MRGHLSDSDLKQIADKLPIVDSRLFLATMPSPGIHMRELVDNSKLSIALVCLSDAGERLGDVCTSLHEAYACLEWYRKLSPKAPLNFEAVSTCKYYLDYTTLLLYATAEDLSFFIIHFLNIEQPLKAYLKDPKIQKKLEKNKISSNAGKVGVYLEDKLPSEGITQITKTLRKNTSWKKAIDYRNTWVHSKPPIIAGSGIQYARKSMIVTLDDGTKRMYFGGGDPPEYTIDELLDIVHLASDALAKALSDLVQILIERRQKIGEKFDFQNGKVVLDM